MTVQFIHRVVFVGEFGRLVRITGQYNIFGAVTDLDGDPAYLGEVAADIVRNRVRGVAPAGGLGDMQGQRTHRSTSATF